MAQKKTNKLLKALGGKEVTVSFKSGELALVAVLLDMDDEHYFLGENTSITSVVRKNEVQMILDNSLIKDDDSLFTKPPGTKMQ